jgi:hypothetical protein
MMFRAAIRNGKLSSRVLAHIVREAREGDTFWIEMKENKPTRSESQNSLYWAYLSLIEKETGNNKDDLHEYFKANLLDSRKAEITLKGGSKLEFIKPTSTTKLSKTDFSEYMDRIERLTGVPIPDTSEFNCG